jgi:hypothetical protein
MTVQGSGFTVDGSSGLPPVVFEHALESFPNLLDRAPGQSVCESVRECARECVCERVCECVCENVRESA